VEYQEFLRLTREAEAHLEAGRLKEAETLLLDLIMGDVSDLDRAALCAKMATVFDRLGNTQEALDWFDKGIAAEQAYCRYETLEKKAVYLSQLGRYNNAVKIYEQLLKQPYLTESEKERIRKSLQAQLGKSLSEWR